MVAPLRKDLHRPLMLGQSCFTVKKGVAMFSVVLVLMSLVNVKQRGLFTMTGYENSLRNSMVSTKAKNAATGHIFDGKKIRTFDKDLKCTESKFENGNVPQAIFPGNNVKCSLWGVVTTINEPTESIHRVASLTQTDSVHGSDKWCLVIVGDTKTPDHLYEDMVQQNHTNVVYLSADDQQQISHAFVQAIPYRSFARKNVGYLYAIAHGAKAIFDFDDDNVLKPDTLPYSLVQRDTHQLFRHVPPPTVSKVNATNGLKAAFNPFPLMRPSESGAMSWPRGFPLELVKDDTFAGLHTKVQYGSLPRSSVGVIQSVCDGDPDVDAIYRLTRPLPFTFDNSKEASKLLVPPSSYSPYNAQATVHTEAAFWGLLLPFTVTGRVTDIWRSYFTQRIMQDLQLALLYAPPMVDHTRSPHNYLADMQAEDHLYQRTSALLEFLTEWKADAGDFLPARIEKLWVGLYERDYIGLKDVFAMQNWLIALKDVGYDFPVVPSNLDEVLQGTEAVTGHDHGQEIDEIKRLRIENQKLREALQGANEQPSRKRRSLLSTGLQSAVVEQPELRGQPFLAGPYYNLEGSNTVGRPNQLVVKLVMMTKDEWPLVKYWTLYHGELLGFDNIYIIDDSSDPRCIAFLKHARDHLGANIIFSPAGLNQLTGEMTKIGQHIKGSSDLMLKMDTDEFFLVNHPVGEQKHCTKGEFGDMKNCPLSPYAVDGFLKDMDDWFATSTGQKVKAEMLSMSLPNHNRQICESGNGEEIHHLPLTETKSAGNLKQVYDSRNFDGFELGAHAMGGGDPVRVGMLHFHYRCYHHEVENSKKAVISHNYVDPHMTNEEALAHLQKQGYFGDHGACDTRELADMPRKPSSFHKVLEYAKSLECPEKHKNDFYQGQSQMMLKLTNLYGDTKFNENTGFNVNSEFAEYMDKVLRKYGAGSGGTAKKSNDDDDDLVE